MATGNDDVPVRIRLPKGQQTAHFVKPHETTSDLVAAMESLWPDLAVGDVSWRDRYLTSAANWQQQRLTATWRLPAGAELVLHERPSSVRLTVWDPHGNGEGRTVPLCEEKTAGDVLCKTERILQRERLAENSVFLGEERLHQTEGREARSISCFNPKENKFLHVDTESRAPTEPSSSKFVVRRYLSAVSAIPNSPLHVPSFVVETDVQFLRTNATGHVEPAHPAAMENDAFVALLEGVRCGGARGKVFWGIAGNKYLDPLMGDIFTNRKEIPGEGRRYHVVCLLRRGDRPPPCRVPDGKFLTVFRRAGVQVSIEDGRLCAPKPVKPSDIERWLISYDVDQFKRDVTESARQTD